jgi:cytochrome c-type biogenesis protein CcmH/NrfF
MTMILWIGLSIVVMVIALMIASRSRRHKKTQPNEPDTEWLKQFQKRVRGS